MSIAPSSTSNRSSSDPLIIRLLRTMDMLDTDRLEELCLLPGRDEVTIEESIIRNGLADERQIAQAYANHYLMPLFDPPCDSPSPIDPSIAKVLPSRLCREHLIAPLNDDGQTLEVALFAPDSLLLADEVKLLTGRQMKPLFAPLSVIQRLLRVLYEDGSWTDAVATVTPSNVARSEEQDGFADEHLADICKLVHVEQPPLPGRDGRIVHYINDLFVQALHTGASDIHIEPYRDACRVRLRVDGVLTEISPPPTQLRDAFINRLKGLSKMNIVQCGLPQDGVIELRSSRQRFELRVSTCPTVDGEKIVLRVLDKNAVPYEMTQLGLDDRQLHDLAESIRSPDGLMLVTGPSGSGKSSTLYSCLHDLNDNKTNICAVEDTVKLRLAGINQVQTQSQVGFTFASAVRMFLRQDPDVIMVGEVNDGETAEMCMRAALMGNFVLSTLHTSDALSSIVRLKEMGIPSSLLASTIRLLVAQRMVRRLCRECKEPYLLDAATAKRYGLDPSIPVFRAKGCASCRESGYRGRLAVFELIRINSHLQELIQTEQSTAALQHAAMSDGMTVLAQNATAKVKTGETSLEEANFCMMPPICMVPPTIC